MTIIPLIRVCHLAGAFFTLRASTSSVTLGSVAARTGDVKRLALSALLPALTILLGWSLRPFRHDANPDMAYYRAVASDFLQSGRWRAPDGGPATLYPPGYPLIVAGIESISRASAMPGPWTYAVFTLACLSATSALLFLLAREAWGGQMAIVVPAAWSLHPFMLWTSGKAGTEAPFLPLFCGSVLLFSRSLAPPVSPKRCFLAGCLIGAAMLVRPIAVGFGALLAASVWPLSSPKTSRASRLALAASLALGNALIISPWLFWLHRNDPDAGFISSGTHRAIRDGLTFSARRKGFREAITLPAGAQRLAEDLSARYEDLDSAAAIATALHREASRRPLAVLELMAIKAARAFYATDSGKGEGFVLAFQLLQLPLLGFCMNRAWASGGEERSLAALCGLSLAYFWLMTFTALSIARYLLPALALSLTLLPALLKPRDIPRGLKR